MITSIYLYITSFTTSLMLVITVYIPFEFIIENSGMNSTYFVTILLQLTSILLLLIDIISEFHNHCILSHAYRPAFLCLYYINHMFTYVYLIYSI